MLHLARRKEGPTRLGFALGFVLVALALPGQAADVPKVDPRAWTELDIVPMPKEIRLTDKDVTLDPQKVVLIVGERKCRQSEIGAERINQRIAQLGGRPLSILTENAMPASPLAIIIGTRSDNALVEEAAKSGVVHVGENNPGERGYEIRMSRNGQRLYLAGADNIGALYACVTFGELLEKRGDVPTWRAAEVRDWPDLIPMVLGLGFVGTTDMPELMLKFKAVKSSNNVTEARRTEYLDAFREYYDHLLRRKVALLSYSLYLRGASFVHVKGMDVVREGIEYGKERGIGAMVHAEQPFVALASRYPEVAQSDMGLKNAGPHPRYKRWIRCWSMDDLRRKTAHELAQFIQATGLTDVNFHDTDTGGPERPAQWNERCAACRERWGDDYASATIHKHKIYCDEIRKLNPDVHLNLVFYPYSANVFDQQCEEQALAAQFGQSPAVKELAEKYRLQYTDMWRRAHAAFPPDRVTFCTREAPAQAMQALRGITPGRGLFIGFALMSHAWRPFFSEAACWSATFVDNLNDTFAWVTYVDDFVPLEGLAVREYSWNGNTPGARPWDRLPPAEQWKHAEARGPIYDLILPRIARNFFSREAAPYIVEAMRQNVDVQQIFNKQRTQFTWLKDSGKMQWQADNAERGAKALDALWARCKRTQSRMGMDDFAFRRFIHLRERFHTGMWMAKARAQNFLARELAMKQDVPAAQKAIETGLEYVRQGTEDKEKLLQERPDDPVFRGRDFNRWAGNWREFTADRADFALADKALTQTRSELKELGALGAVPEQVADALARYRLVSAHPVQEPLRVDGADTESAWATALPIESFLVAHGGLQVAGADTRAELLYDDAHLYVFVSCREPGNQDVPDADCVELFLKTPGLKNDYVHFFVYPDGKLRQQYNKVAKADGATRTSPDNSWQCTGIQHATRREANRWSTEIAIPVASISGKPGTGVWSVNICRNVPTGGKQELSSILPPEAQSFHDVSLFRRIQWSPAPYPPLSVVMEPSEFRVATETLPDTIASVASFHLQVDADRVLHNAVLEAEAYDADGKLQARKTLAKLDRLMSRWVAPDTYIVEYRQVCEQGGVLLKLTCEEGTAQRWIRFGGWKGTDQVGAIFSAAQGGTSGLAGECLFPDRLFVDGKEIPLLNAARGTVEFWVRPSREDRWLPPSSRGEIRVGSQAFLHYGPVRAGHPVLTNNSPLTILHDATRGRIHVNALGAKYAGYFSSADVTPDKTAAIGWHHTAVVWDAKADKDNMLRIYLDGRKASGVDYVGHEDRLPASPTEVLDTTQPFPIQVGSLNSGWCGADAVIANLRISRVPRYTDDFLPDRKVILLDSDTTALFRFDRTVAGEGMTPGGERYTLEAAAGVIVNK